MSTQRTDSPRRLIRRCGRLPAQRYSRFRSSWGAAERSRSRVSKDRSRFHPRPPPLPQRRLDSRAAASLRRRARGDRACRKGRPRRRHDRAGRGQASPPAWRRLVRRRLHRRLSRRPPPLEDGPPPRDEPAPCRKVRLFFAPGKRKLGTFRNFRRGSRSNSAQRS